MKLEIFKPSDFVHEKLIHFYSDPIEIVKQANALLNEWIKANGVKVYRMRRDSDFWHPMENYECLKNPDKYDASGILINIEPIAKKCEKHEPMIIAKSQFTDDHLHENICAHCEVKLKAEWKEIE